MRRLADHHADSLQHNAQYFSLPARGMSTMAIAAVRGSMAFARFKASLMQSTTRQSSVGPIFQLQKRGLRTREMPAPKAQAEKENDETAATPWQTLLGMSARAAWRASSPSLPASLVETQIEILERGQRTSKQLKRTFQNIFNAHTALADRRERERRRAKNRLSRPDSLKNKADIAQDVSIKPVYYRQEQTLSSLRHRLLPNYAIVKRVLMEAQSLIGPQRWKPEQVIDFGIGCGGASAAALDVFDSIDWVHGIDPSRSMLDCGELVLNGVSQDRPLPARVTLNSSLSTDTIGSQSVGFDLAIFAYTATELPHTASTLAAAAALWEKLRPNGVFVMVEPGTPDGFNSIRSVRSMLLDCCPSGEAEEVGRDECHIIAPCTHNKTCPMERHRYRSPGGRSSEDDLESKEYEEVDTDDEDNEYYEDEDTDLEENDEQLGSLKTTMAETDVFKSSFCSFVHTMPGADHRSKGEKLSYLVAQKRIAGDPETDDECLDKRFNEFHDTNVSELLAKLCLLHTDRTLFDRNVQDELRKKVAETEMRYLDSEDDVGLELLRGDKNRSSFGRMIRAPLKKRGHVLVDYCGAREDGDDGRIIRHRVSRGWCTKVAPGMYAAARKARWGGLWPDLMESINHCDDADEDSEVL